jgi:4-hydroxybenzoate polyprenyltransferase
MLSNKQIKAIIKLLRIDNLAIILISQFLVYHFIPANGEVNNDWKIIMLITGTVLIAAAGNIINDYYDRYIDSINKPRKVLDMSILSETLVKSLYLTINFAALFLALFINVYVLVVFIAAVSGLWFYSRQLKKVLFAGNLLIALLMALTVFVPYLINPTFDLEILGFYVAFAFISGLSREVVKDCEDLEGDRTYGIRSIAVRFGTKPANFLVLLLVTLLSFLQIYIAKRLYFDYRITSLTLIFLSFFLLVSAYYSLPKANTKRDYKLFSRILKIYILTGTISIITLAF